MSYLVAVSPRLAVPQSVNSQVERHIRDLRTRSQEYAGIIHFLPFLMNGKKLRGKVERELRKPIAFVDLSHNTDSLERKFAHYGERRVRLF